MFFEDRKKFAIIIILTVFAAISAVMLFKHSYEWNLNDARIPAVSRGNFVVFYEELSNTAQIKKIDATERYIYILYSGFGVVAVYDWTGAYQFSMAFFTNTNGTIKMRCDNELLYVSDHEHYEYVFSGDSLIHKFEPTDEENLHYGGWFSQMTTQPFRIANNAIYTQSGDFVMELPGKI